MHFFLLLLSLPALNTATATAPSIGVIYNPRHRALPSSDLVASSLISSGISHLLIQSPSPSHLRSFLYSPVSLILSLPLTSSINSTSWLSDHLLPFHPRLKIAALALPFPGNNHTSIASLRSSLSSLGLPTFPISIIHSFSIISPAFPPSDARFSPNLTDSYIKPLLKTLAVTNSPFFIDLYPFDLFRSDPSISIGFAMFDQAPFDFRIDPVTGLRYRNLFDSMVDAVFVAMGKVGHKKIPVVVTATGWPTGGGARAATVKLAGRSNRGLVEHLRTGLGTPMRKNGVEMVFVREMFDEMGNREELDWGIWYRNLSLKYEIGLSASGTAGGGARGMVVVGWLVWVMLVAGG